MKTSKTTLKVFLKKNWSEQFIYGDKTPGFFVGRDQEIRSLRNVIEGNNSSAILISSVRGVGKTSFVHKALSETEGVHPIFVNVGHALANADNNNKDNGKKLLLISLIRATYFNKEFSGDEKLKPLYKRCFAKYTEEVSESKESTSERGLNIGGEIKANGVNLVALVGVILTTSGIFVSDLGLRILLGIAGISSLFLSVSWNKKWLDSVLQKNSDVIDNSTEYLEIEFENWLRAKQEKKIVFVIDELDKVDEAKSLESIKEYKNLFNRSFAHFIFISSQKAFDLMSEDRENDPDEGGIFPTLFTHVLYLSLPKSEELKKYLLEIIDSRNLDKTKQQELLSYILFRSGNDFFDVKRLISDIISFDENDKPFIDTVRVKESDSSYARAASLYEYVDKWFLKKSMKELKKHWRDNSRLQKHTFTFLNANLTRNFYKEVITPETNRLVEFLISVGVLDTQLVERAAGEVTVYKWTRKYYRTVDAPLLEDDKKFNTSFKSLVKLANDLDDLPTKYETKDFITYESVYKDMDGQKLSGINLFATYKDYEDTYAELADPASRMTVTTEKTKEAREIIDEQIKNVYEEYFKVATNALDTIFGKNTQVFCNEQITSGNYGVNQAFDSLPGFLAVAAPTAYEMGVYGKTDTTKYVLLIRNFEDITHVEEALNMLRSRGDILIVNLVYGDKFNISHANTHLDKLGRKRKKGMEVKNFVNFEFNDFRQLADLFVRVETFLK